MKKYLLVEKMKSAGFTQEKMAKEIGISVRSFNLKLHGKSKFTITEADEICIKLGINNKAEQGEIFFTQNVAN